MRTRKKTWTEKELTDNSRVIHNPSEYKGRWQEYFQNGNPIHLELGCGKGRFITGMAAENANINFIALERDPTIIAMGARLSKKLDGSLGFMLGDVRDLRECFGEGEISRIYINFCDPWPNKKKWAKRRLTHTAFLDLYEDILNECGEVFFKTDNRELFEFSLNQFCEKGWRLRNISLDLHNSGYGQMSHADHMTEYEEKFSSQGFPIYRCEAYINCANERKALE